MHRIYVCAAKMGSSVYQHVVTAEKHAITQQIVLDKKLTSNDNFT